MKKVNLLIVLSLMFVLSSCEKYPDLDNGLYAEFKTTKGDFTAKLNHEKAPMTVGNFVALAEGKHPSLPDSLKGKPFFDGLKFHVVIEDMMVQTGSPNGDPSGNPGYKFPNEVSDSLKHDSKGVLSMINLGPGTNGSQFFITLSPQPRLDGRYSVFGKVVKNQKVVDSIGAVETNKRKQPKEDINIETVNIIRKGKAAKNFDAVSAFTSTKEKIANEKEKARQERMEKFEEMTSDFETTASGLKYKIRKKNPSGDQPESGQTVRVDYTGKLVDGSVFDSSKDREPIEFPIGRGNVIPGWDEGIMLLHEGEKATLAIPSELAYGPRGKGPIPPNSPLIFEVELIEVVEK